MLATALVRTRPQNVVAFDTSAMSIIIFETEAKRRHPATRKPPSSGDAEHSTTAKARPSGQFYDFARLSSA